ncbi:MAG TPA: zonular occludens toxin domain-containing protein [Xylella sp.]
MTGIPGNGKTLYAVDWIIRQIEIDRALVAKGGVPRSFYTDIEGFDVQAVQRLTGYVVQVAPEDWRTTPHGSVIVYDEAHRLFGTDGRSGRSPDSKVRELDTHRHGGYDIMFITQRPTKIHHEVRGLVGEHVHLGRAMGLEVAGLLRWPRAQDDPYDKRERAGVEEEIWRFPKERYALYRSSSLHTASHKFRVPKKVWSGLSYLFAVIGILWFLYHRYAPSGKTSVQVVKREEGRQPPPAPSVSSVLPAVSAYPSLPVEFLPSLAGCVSSARSCRCFNVAGYQIDMTSSACRRLLQSPLPFDVYHQYSVSASDSRSSSSSVSGLNNSSNSSNSSSFSPSSVSSSVSLPSSLPVHTILSPPSSSSVSR